MGTFAVGFCLPGRTFLNCNDVSRINLCDGIVLSNDENQPWRHRNKVRMSHPNSRAVAQPKNERIMILVHALPNYLCIHVCIAASPFVLAN
jgi:hypothetical protein